MPASGVVESEELTDELELDSLEELLLELEELLEELEEELEELLELELELLEELLLELSDLPLSEEDADVLPEEPALDEDELLAGADSLDTPLPMVMVRVLLLTLQSL